MKCPRVLFHKWKHGSKFVLSSLKSLKGSLCSFDKIITLRMNRRLPLKDFNACYSCPLTWLCNFCWNMLNIQSSCHKCLVNSWKLYKAPDFKENVLDSFYLPQTKLREGKFFTPVCQSFCSQGLGGCLPQCMLGYTPSWADPPRQTPPWADSHTSRLLLLWMVRILLDSTPLGSILFNIMQFWRRWWK